VKARFVRKMSGHGEDAGPIGVSFVAELVA
jgi:hypothetical protein